ncbi:unnamed protein product [Periconia digitata]|uniref:Uncharacterized protein n=1 Tax=Periconia digitata TaxID=1303443 RepID=A0A9W4UAV1_9PLEO|nr:unnamed protein product [Periconia digitata]
MKIGEQEALARPLPCLPNRISGIASTHFLLPNYPTKSPCISPPRSQSIPTKILTINLPKVNLKSFRKPCTNPSPSPLRAQTNKQIQQDAQKSIPISESNPTYLYLFTSLNNLALTTTEKKKEKKNVASPVPSIPSFEKKPLGLSSFHSFHLSSSCFYFPLFFSFLCQLLHK